MNKTNEELVERFEKKFLAEPNHTSFDYKVKRDDVIDFLRTNLPTTGLKEIDEEAFLYEFKKQWMEWYGQFPKDDFMDIVRDTFYKTISTLCTREIRLPEKKEHLSFCSYSEVKGSEYATCNCDALIHNKAIDLCQQAIDKI